MNPEEVVGNLREDLDRSPWVANRPVHFRDLDEHIQDRLRAADEVVKAASEIGPDEVYDGECYCGVASDAQPSAHAPDCEWRVLQAALAAYKATFKEASK